MEIIYAGVSDVGCDREINEDYVQVKTFGEDIYFGVVLDGVGSINTQFQPAVLVYNEIYAILKQMYEADAEMLKKSPEVALRLALSVANRVLGAFRVANEVLYSGYSAAITCCLISDGQITFAHSGNTRLYLIRRNKKGEILTRQLTKDHTVAQELMDKGEITTADEYHTHPDRAVITSGIGNLRNPIVQTFTLPLLPNDLILMTTDGIHYAVRKEAMRDIVLMSGTCDDAVQMLVEAAKSEKYADNMSAVLFWVKGDEQ